jgi:Cu/Ag efflux pump CusA
LKIDGLVDVNVEQQVEIPQLQIKPKREMLKHHGIQVNEFAEFIDVAFAGEKVSDVYEGNMSFDLVLRYNRTLPGIS